MKKREAEFTILFRHWLRANPTYSGAFELKQTTSDMLPFDAVKTHQLEALQAAESDRGLLYKAPDDSRGVKPFDLFYLRNAVSYVVIRYPHFFCLILLRVFVNEKVRSTRKSLTAGRAREICTVCVDIK